MDRLLKNIPYLVSAAVVCLLCAAFPCFRASAAQQDAAGHNIMIVLDASGSMDKDRNGGLGADPEKLRFDMIQAFLYTLADPEDAAGYVIFSTRADEVSPPRPAADSAAKDALYRELRDYTGADRRYTNIGLALESALHILQEDQARRSQEGKPSLAPAILLLSDGITDLDDNPGVLSDAERESLRQKEAAVRAAEEAGIPIYGILLNINGQSDFSEMTGIAGTLGEAREITRREDLNLIYDFFSEMFSKDEVLHIPENDDAPPLSIPAAIPFTVPGMGVESAQILIAGDVESIRLTGPGGMEPFSPPLQKGNSFSMAQLSSIAPGTWLLEALGREGAEIRIKMTYHSDLRVELDVPEPADGADVLPEKEPLDVTALLYVDGEAASSAENYRGYRAEILAFREDSADPDYTIAMSVPEGGDRFHAKCLLPAGTWVLRASLSAVVEISEDETLFKKVLSDPVTRVLGTVQAPDTTPDTTPDAAPDTTPDAAPQTDPGPDPGPKPALLPLLGRVLALVAGALGLIAAVYVLVRKFGPKRFYGCITVSYVSGDIGTKCGERNPAAGKYPLSRFDMKAMKPGWLTPGTAYFEATGLPYIWFYPGRDVIWNGNRCVRVRIEHGARVVLTPAEELPNRPSLIIQFKSRVTGGRSGAGKAGAGRSGGGRSGRDDTAAHPKSVGGRSRK